MTQKRINTSEELARVFNLAKMRSSKPHGLTRIREGIEKVEEEIRRLRIENEGLRLAAMRREKTTNALRDAGIGLFLLALLVLVLYGGGVG